MERLVVELDKITFQGNFHSDFTENSALPLHKSDCPQFLKFTVTNCLSNMSILCDEQMPEKCMTTSSEIEEVDALESSGTISTNSSISEENEDTDEHNSQSCSIGNLQKMYSGDNIKRNLRNLPSRASSRKSLNKRDVRKISMKPAKISKRSTGKLQPSEIKKLYCNQKLKRFHPTKLETIFEEPQPIHSQLSNNTTANDEQFRWIGTAKLKRSLNCCDGFNINKTVIKQRRAMIKKKLGRRNTWKKIPLSSFIEHMQKTEINPEKECASNMPEMQKSDALKPNSIETAATVAENEEMRD